MQNTNTSPTAHAAQNQYDDVTINVAQHDGKAIALNSGGRYMLNFDKADIQKIELIDGVLVISLKNGETIEMTNTHEAFHSYPPATILFEDRQAQGEFFSLFEHGRGDNALEALKTQTLEQDEPSLVEDIVDNLLNTEPAANDEQLASDLGNNAENLADIEPAAGNGSPRGGFGFGSSVDAYTTQGLDAVGNIDATNLGVPTPDYNLSINPVNEADAPPAPDSPGLTIENISGGNDFIVKEDGTIKAVIDASLSDDATPAEYLSVRMSGLDSDWGDFDFNGLGTYDSATGEWVLTLPAGTDLSDVFCFTPNPDSDIDLSGLTFVVTQINPDTGETITVSDDFDIIVDAVADVPNLSADDATVDEGSNIDLDIETSLNDLDGSEIIESITVAGVPDGVTLSAGTFDPSSGLWTLTPDQLTGLTANTTDGSAGVYTLTITSTSYEQNTNGNEPDTSDNRASLSTTVVLTVIPEDLPTVDDANTSIEEAALDGATTSVSGSISHDFSVDGPGNIEGNGFSSNVNNLQYNGQDITITYNAATQTYEGTAGGESLFTFVINSNGTYNFTLNQELDHDIDASQLQFGVQITDADGDTDTSVVTVTVNDDGIVAHDDVDGVNGSTGETATGNVLDNDTLSEDGQSVTKISFNGEEHDIAVGDSHTIDGDYGTLTIHSDGSYSYELTYDPIEVLTELAPTADLADGISPHATENGYTLLDLNGGDLSWISGLGGGIGTDGDPIFGNTDELAVSVPESPLVMVSIGHLSDAEARAGITVGFRYAMDDGTVGRFEVDISPDQISGYIADILLDASQLDGVTNITSFSIYSLTSTITLNNIQTININDTDVSDSFTYLLTDGDGDTDSATLTLNNSVDTGLSVARSPVAPGAFFDPDDLPAFEQAVFSDDAMQDAIDDFIINGDKPHSAGGAESNDNYVSYADLLGDSNTALDDQTDVSGAAV